ncbi:hypothetical protein HMPREF0424_0370 [Gardnerella vaginalis 409-05]|nr:hypothetical protein HMPREF0424_0370 [Gardnerella vaginalis 409-05]
MTPVAHSRGRGQCVFVDFIGWFGVFDSFVANFVYFTK